MNTFKKLLSEFITNYVSSILICIVSFIQTYTVWHYYCDVNHQLSHSMILIPVFIGMILMNRQFLTRERRIRIFSLIFGFCLSLALWAGYELYPDNTLANGLTNLRSFLKSILWITGGTCLVATLFAYVLTFYNSVEDRSMSSNFTDFLPIKKSIPRVLLLALVLIIAWFPLYLAFYPGVISYDLAYQIPQALGEVALSNHNPILHTLLLSWFLKLDQIIPHTNIGLALFILFQMIVLALSCAFMVDTLYQYVKNKFLTVLGLLFLAFFPTISIFANLPMKDTLFSASFVFFCTIATRICLKNKMTVSDTVWLIIAGFLCAAFRNNGIYPVIATLLLMLIFLNGKKKLLVAFLTTFVAYELLMVLFFQVLHFTKSPSQEMLSVPISQICAITITSPNSLSANEFDEVHSYIPDVDNYNPRFADTTKTTFNSQLYQETPLQFWSLWLKLCMRNPLIATNAFLSLNLPYWYPDAKYVDDYSNRRYMELTFNSTDFAAKTSYVFTEQNLFPWLKAKAEAYANTEHKIFTIPVINWFLTLSMPFWMLFSQACISMYKKKKETIIFCAPAVLMLTYLAGPVSNLRYLLPFLCVLPLFTGIAIGRITTKKSAT